MKKIILLVVTVFGLLQAQAQATFTDTKKDTTCILSKHYYHNNLEERYIAFYHENNKIKLVFSSKKLTYGIIMFNNKTELITTMKFIIENFERHYKYENSTTIFTYDRGITDHITNTPAGIIGALQVTGESNTYISFTLDEYKLILFELDK